MPNVSPVFILKVLDAANNIVQAATKAFKFTGQVALTNIPGERKVEVNVGSNTQVSTLFYDFIEDLGPWINFWGSGAVSSDDTSVDENHWGILLINANQSNSIGPALNISTPSVMLGGARTIFESLVKIPVLSTVTDPFSFDVGLGSEPTGDATEWENGVSFQYKQPAYGDFWNLKSIQNNIATEFQTTIPVVAGQWYKLRCEINATATQASFYIDDVLASSLITNIPVTPFLVTPAYRLLNFNNAISSVQIYTDYYLLQATLTR